MSFANRTSKVTIIVVQVQKTKHEGKPQYGAMGAHPCPSLGRRLSKALPRNRSRGGDRGLPNKVGCTSKSYRIKCKRGRHCDGNKNSSERRTNERAHDLLNAPHLAVGGFKVFWAKQLKEAPFAAHYREPLRRFPKEKLSKIV